jgi:hypothetical protein
LLSVRRVRPIAVVGAILLLLAAVLGVAPGVAQSPVRQVVSQAVAVPAPVTVAGVDLHDGMLAKFGPTYYLYGTEYACGFTWLQAGTPWCGFGVSTSTSLSGPWSTPTLLFSATDTDPWTGQSWQVECGSTGQGCFNPRMIQRTGWGSDDGVFILWFNSPIDYSRNHSNAYNALGCNGPAGPCGPSAGTPHGSYTKPSLYICSGNGDFGFIDSGTVGQTPAIVCTMAGATGLSVEQLNQWGVGGTGAGAHNVAGLSGVEGPGGWYDAATGAYVLTYSDPECGYCTGAGAGYATASSLLGPYTAPINVAAAAPPATGRRDFSATSCGGQPRTVSVVDGVPYQGIDLWLGTPNETGAALHYEPLTYTPGTGTAGDGQLWRPALAPLTCT